MFDSVKFRVEQLWQNLSENIRRLISLYRPNTMAEKGIVWSSGLIIVTLILVIVLLGFLWNKEPDPFNVRQVALERADGNADALVTGYIFTSTLEKIGETLLDKRGGYLSNDRLPPGVLMDNVPNWEFGVLVILRDASSALRNHFSRSQTQSTEDPDLGEAEPKFNFNNNNWILPPTESIYRDGIGLLAVYRMRLADKSRQDTQFYARADNLRQYLEIVEKRLGSLSQRLSASVGQVRLNTDLAGDPEARQATRTPGTIVVKTSWNELDDVFYEARGATWALMHILIAIEHDFADVLGKKNAVVSLRQIIRELEATQQYTLSPVILNGSGFGIFANYSLTLANYVARADAAIIDLRELLARG